MSEAVEAIRLRFAREESNVEPYLGEGWRAAETGRRGADGPRSVVRLPPLRAQKWFALSVQGFSLDAGGATPQPILTLEWNGAALRTLRLVKGTPMAVPVPGELVRAHSENVLVLKNACSPGLGPGDARPLSLALQRLDVEPLDAPLALSPRLLAPAPPADSAEEKAIAEMFQSLGQSCDLGNVQRRYGAEPFGLLRFAGIHPGALIHGLRTRFAGVGDADKLTFFNHDDSRELQGRHAVYGLNYHTFKWVDETDVAALIVTESKRLGYLARLFFEQLENNEKIFVRAEQFETPEEALALHLLLRAYHPRARLLVLQAAPEALPERIGRVLELRPGLYRGYVSRMSDPDRDPIRPLHEEWMQLFAAIVADENALSDAFSYEDRRQGAEAGEAVDHVRLTFAGEAANAEPYLREGWHGQEPTHRWMDGRRSVLRLPPLRAQERFVLTLRGWPLDVGAPAQTLTVRVNGEASPPLRLVGGTPMAVPVAGEFVRADAQNTIVLEHPHAARPSDWRPGHPDTRWLSLALTGLDFEPLDMPLHPVPRLLPEVEPPRDSEQAKALMEGVQSLGQNCALGGAQRHYGAEPFGLLRFASVHPSQLVEGLQTRFKGVGDLALLSFPTFPGRRELQGHHAVYGLDYHTFKNADETDVAAFAATEARRLAYLARLFFEQLENNEKIFVRLASFEQNGEALALHRLLCAYHPQVRLLILDRPPPDAPERAGRVAELRPGLYRGHFLSHEDPVHGPRPPPEQWLSLLASVVTYERG